MAVYALKYNSLSVKLHQAVRNLKPPEAYLNGNDLLKPSLPVGHLNYQSVQIRLLRTPQKRLFHRNHKMVFPFQGRRHIRNHSASFHQTRIPAVLPVKPEHPLLLSSVTFTRPSAVAAKSSVSSALSKELFSRVCTRKSSICTPGTV